MTLRLNRTVILATTFILSCGRDTELCNSKPESELSFRVDSLGMVEIGSEILIETGHAFLRITPDCTFFLKSSSYAETFEGQLTSSQSEQLAHNLRLNDWPSGAAMYSTSMCDGPVEKYRLNDSRLTVTSVCHGPNTSEGVSWLRTAVRDALPELTSFGTVRVSALRYAVVAEDPELHAGLPQYRNAPAWPLATPIAEVAQAFDSSTRGIGRQVEGDDAEALAALDRAHRVGEIGRPWFVFVPINENGKLYRLYVRAALPFEDEVGNWQPF